ncbi:MAG: hypothetical protein FJ100_15615 [Deltaproteobacteria bacterium]|nr:hypothetical protein [Deltaproteobacteria bacterium]
MAVHSRWSCSLVALLALWVAPAVGQEVGVTKKVGLGVGSGTKGSLGLTAKYYLGDDLALLAFVGRNGVRDTAVSLDCVVEPLQAYKHPSGRLHVGGGAGLAYWGSAGSKHVAVAGIVQVGWQFAALPVEVIADWRPFYELDDALQMGALGGALRWFF